MQRIIHSIFQMLGVNMLVSWANERLKSCMLHQSTFRSFIPWKYAKWDFSNHDVFRKILNPGSQQWAIQLQYYASTNSYQSNTGDVRMPQLRQHSCNCLLASLVNMFDTVWGTWKQHAENSSTLLRCPVDTVCNDSTFEIWLPGMLIAKMIGPVSLLTSTNHWQYSHSGWKLILRCPPPIAVDHHTIYLTSLGVSTAHQLKIVVSLKIEMCNEELDTFKNILKV